ncbi:hypothetical protein BD779DRAFT_566403 [Infundibulicybe gibba]|nr:hypothetical protein BD779DRAFT_566403 [Infundibulicybe gibba]
MVMVILTHEGSLLLENWFYHPVHLNHSRILSRTPLSFFSPITLHKDERWFEGYDYHPQHFDYRRRSWWYLLCHRAETSFRIYEQSADIGGTWNTNTYPGCAPDTPIYLLASGSSSSSPTPNSPPPPKPKPWSSSHPTQPEIHAHWRAAAEQHGLTPNISLNRRVTAVVWDPVHCVYHVETLDVTPPGANPAQCPPVPVEASQLCYHISGAAPGDAPPPISKRKTTWHIVISAIGGLQVPNFPDIDGMENFSGRVVHTALWGDGVGDLRGKRIAVVGNGLTAAQLIPTIAEEPGVQIVQFCRSPNWIAPPKLISRWCSSVMGWILYHVPLLVAIYWFYLYLESEFMYLLLFKNRLARNVLKYVITNYILQTTPQKYHDKMIPNHDLGCKPIITDAGYLNALNRANLELNWDGITRIGEHGIISKTGEKLPFDVIVLATGFITDAYPLYVRGTSTLTVQGYFKSQRGPKAYLGTTIPGFPNFFMLFGPNTAPGYGSMGFMEDTQINYIMQLLKPLIRRTVISLEVTAQATDEYNHKLQHHISQSVFARAPSTYRVGNTGRVSFLFHGMFIPARRLGSGSMTSFWWLLRRPKWGHYKPPDRTEKRITC